METIKEGSRRILCPDASALADRAVELIQACATQAVHDRGQFVFALAGGSTPEATYRRLAMPKNSSAIDWLNTFLFFGDERFVPADDPRSNFAMVQRTLLTPLPIREEHVFPVPTDRATAADAAKAYADQLVRFFANDIRHSPPRFDLVLLGIGDDGHTASLFPGTPALDVVDAWVTWSAPGRLPPPVERVTLTFPVLNAARNVLFLVSGESKADAVYDVLEGNVACRERPAAGVRPKDGVLTWLLDASAASRLTGSV